MKSILRIFLIVIAFLILVFVFFANAVHDGKSVRDEAYLSAREIAKESADMVKYNDFYMYRGNEAWDVIVGEDSEGNEIGVWIPVESTTDEENTSDEESTPDEESTLNEETASNEESTSNEEAASNEEATSDEETTTNEEAASNEEASSNEGAVAQEDQPIEESTGQGYILSMDAYISEQDAIEAATTGKDVKEVVSVNLGMEDEVVIWEVTCINSKGNYSYYYVNAETSELIKSYENI